ncbi:carbohydrate ABC transporter permease [Paenibacillus qinlingensis]|uniref:Raffinose/stachyose/melibiose transport system permease protein n=1 Tax=Paenibacillus qinlingensis TaxID=1837343 RepID=A0ABU1P1A3_9BACL|nr:carbohydrate ABC transporter permease [Paenibacillus qinlingensis]MDR6553525.1 raffinose/stachyose/melibiose transport system permease protein [Paenibacillus qinlingensis]
MAIRMDHVMKWLGITLLAIVVIVISVPVLYVFVSSLKTTVEINRVVLIPEQLYWTNYGNVFKNKLVLHGIWNSMFITTASMAVAVVVSSLAGYAIGRRGERVFRFLYLFFLSAMMIPVGSSLVSLYTIIKSLGLINSAFGLILIYAAQAIPMGILLYSGFVKTIPRELDEAATIDGCGYYRRFSTVVFPLMKPVSITFIVISAIGIWNDFLMPLLFITSEVKRTLPLAVYSFTSSHAADLGGIFAMLTIAVVPPILFFAFMRNYFFEGLTAGAVKG